MDNLESFDVVLFNDAGSALNGRLMLVSGVLKSGQVQLGRTSIDVKLFTEDGIKCVALQALEGQGWRNGKVRFRLEFIPDQPNQEVEDESEPIPLLLPADEEFGSPDI